MSPMPMRPTTLSSMVSAIQSMLGRNSPRRRRRSSSTSRRSVLIVRPRTISATARALLPGWFVTVILNAQYPTRSQYLPSPAHSPQPAAPPPGDPSLVGHPTRPASEPYHPPFRAATDPSSLHRCHGTLL